MRVTEQCPKCHFTTLWVIDKVLQPDPTSSGITVPLVITAGHDLAKNWVVAGTLTAYVCDQCGYTELYARDFREQLATLTTNGWNGVRLLSRQGPRGPFR